jgi:hypothetical protein
MINKNKKRIKRYFLLMSIFMLPLAASAESTCSVEPFSSEVSQGDTASLSLLLHTDDLNAPFEVNLGNLPDAVESGFLKKENMETIGNVKKIPLIVQTKENAQIGSFMISVIYKTSTIKESICQFNLEVNKKILGKPASQISQTVVKTISSGVLSTSTSDPGIRPQVAVLSKEISLGSVGDEVRHLQEILKFLGFFPVQVSVTGYFGRITEYAVKEFQNSKKIESIGIVGPKTRKALNELLQ